MKRGVRRQTVAKLRSDVQKSPTDVYTNDPVVGEMVIYHQSLLTIRGIGTSSINRGVLHLVEEVTLRMNE